MILGKHNATHYRDIAEQVLERSYFERNTTTPPDLSWLDAIFEGVRRFLSFVYENLIRPLLSKSYDELSTIDIVVNWLVIILLCSAFIFLCFFLVKKLRHALLERQRDQHFDSTLENDSPVVGLLKKAHSAAAAHDYSLAIRLLFLSSILHLQSILHKRSLSCYTNKEYLDYFKDTPAQESLATMSDLLNYWYKGAALEKNHFEQCLRAHHDIVATTSKDYAQFSL